MPHTGGSKSIATLMDELAKDGIEPSRAEIFLKIHKRRKDGRPLDEESTKAVELIEEKLNNGKLSNEESINGVAWKGDVYSQVLGSDRSGYERGLGLGQTPFLLWDGVIGIGITVTVVGPIVGGFVEAIANIEIQDESSKQLSQNDSLEQLNFVVQIEEYKRMIATLDVEAAEKKAKS
ncbi:uncharacterized protein LOC110265345 [Arachis ipaensis]|uniref:uncharacterized protein LOC110265345 n=1 Tax=Arachis ipaensis TaxID=130454 RepID=UPI000A2B22BE|nr:uncharacterized protein LOC110265345 [Arachis ipaensis]